MGRGTRADGAIVLAYHQGGVDGPVRAESREPTLGSDRGLLACRSSTIHVQLYKAGHESARCARAQVRRLAHKVNVMAPMASFA